MHKSLLGLVAASAVGLAALAGPSPANAGCYGCAVGAGVIGGIAAGAIIGSAIAQPYYYGGYGGYYGGYGYSPDSYGYGYYAPAAYPYAAPTCVWRRIWNGYTWVRACV